MRHDDPNWDELVEAGKDTVVRLVNHPFKTIGRWLLLTVLWFFAVMLALSGGMVLGTNQQGSIGAGLICLLLAFVIGAAAWKVS